MLELPVNLDELAFVLHRGPELHAECFLDCETGEIIYIPTDTSALNAMFQSIFEPERLNVEALARDITRKDTALKYIPDNFSQVVFELMTSFIESTSFPAYLQKKLEKAIQSKGGYSEFHSILKGAPKFHKKFINFKDEFFVCKAIEWLKENNILIQSRE
ncbi:MAG: hypothetical protein J7L94_13875 [Caldisericaceae bacterium]|nr:hypothetical protein [Caldisericaceae bacterium]